MLEVGARYFSKDGTSAMTTTKCQTFLGARKVQHFPWKIRELSFMRYGSTFELSYLLL